jgi:UDP-glucose 4-epimerase
MRSALVTGGAGYLGSHLAKALKQAGYYTFCFDLMLPENKKYWDNHTTGDVRNLNDLYETFEYFQRVNQKKFDVVFHLAGLIEVGESVHKPEKYWQVNVGGTCNLLNIMREFDVRNIVYSSTAGVYRSQFTSLSEKAEIEDNNPYASSKYAAECAIRNSTMNYLIFRFFNLAGADPDGEMGECHEPETHLIPLMFKSLNNEEFIIYGNDYQTVDGTCVRDYVHVSDVAQAHVLADEYLQRKGNNQPRLLNLGTGKGYTVLQVIEAAKQELNVPIQYKIGKRREGDPRRLVANSDAAKEYLNFKPKHDLKSILRTAYNWYERQRERSTGSSV